jgi:dual specificity phosphatase 12
MCLTSTSSHRFDYLLTRLSSIFTLRRKTTLEEAGITHVLSVLKFDFSKISGFERYEHLGIEVDDMDDENLLREFERTGSWIEKALKEGKNGKKGKVFIHW